MISSSSVMPAFWDQPLEWPLEYINQIEIDHDSY